MKPCFASIIEAHDPTTFTFSREYLTRYHSHLQKPQPTICLGVFDQCLFHYTQLLIRSMTPLDYHLNLPPGFLKRIFLWASLVSEVEMWLLFCIVLSYQGFTGVVVQSTCWRLDVCVTLDLASFSWFSWHGYFHSSHEPWVPSIHVLN